MANTDSLWLSTSHGAVSIDWSRSEESAQGPVVIVVPDIAFEERTEAVGVRPLMAGLMDNDISTVVLHLSGTSQSEGHLSSADCSAQWPEDLRTAVEFARSQTSAGVVVIGIRLTAALASEALSESALLGTVLWAPVDGRRYGREVSLLAPASAGGNSDDRVLTVGTFEVGRDLLESVKQTRVDVSSPGLGRVLVIDDATRTHPGLFSAWDSIDHRTSNSFADWVHVSSDLARIPRVDVEEIVSWVKALAPTGQSKAMSHPEFGRVKGESCRVFRSAGTEISERHFRFGSGRLAGLMTLPQGSVIGGDCWLLVSTTGPGRVFVDFARTEAGRGRPSLRFDLSSIGMSSRREGQGWGEAYSPNASQDVTLAIEWLVEAGYERVNIVGFCAGAIAGLEGATSKHVGSVTAINPQLYVGGSSWRSFDGERGPWTRTENLDNAKSVARRLRWKYRTVLARSSRPVRRVQKLTDAGVRVALMFDSIDPGFTFFERGCNESLRRHGGSENLIVKTYDHLGHVLEGISGRRQLMDDVSAIGDSLFAVDPAHTSEVAHQRTGSR